MSNYSDIEQPSSLIISAIDNLEQVIRARELTNVIWDINLKNNDLEQNWLKNQVLLECYEKMRDEFLASLNRKN